MSRSTKVQSYHDHWWRAAYIAVALFAAAAAHAVPSSRTASPSQVPLRVPLEATPKPAAMPAGKAVRAGVRTPEASDETLSRLLRMRSRLRNLEVDTRWLNREEITQHFTATMGRGHLVGHGYINWSRPEERQWASVEIIGADVEEFLHVADVRFDGKIRAQVSGQLDLEWNGMRFRQMRASMRGKGRLELSKGNVTATRLL
ncbi:MAG: hypothetical protein ACPL7D_08975, partial [Candidatus Sumerlaeaceae bacterium]